MEEQQEVRPNRVQRFIKETLRVIHITKKPNRTEYISLVKVTGLGIAIIGLIGFVLHILKQLLF
ncbi:protein translocase SEC61 complex subunit gamma [Candidatus Woesearchaeota archaeon]|nr:protein translocase SEC61 complex subunit gamma [Candidatus Woesearchaeota archaeon]